MSFTPGNTIINSSAAITAAQTIVSLGSSTTTVAVPGAIVGKHVVFVAPVTDPGSLVIAQAWVSAANTASLRITNLSAVAFNMAKTTWFLALTTAA